MNINAWEETIITKEFEACFTELLNKTIVKDEQGDKPEKLNQEDTE